MAALSRPHHHATPLLSVYSAPISEPTITHATRSRGGLRRVNERAVSDRRIVGHDWLYRNREGNRGLSFYLALVVRSSHQITLVTSEIN